MKARSNVLRRMVLPAAAVPLLAAMCLSMPGTASAAGLTNAQTAAQAAQATKVAVGQAIATSPTDSALKNASSARLITLAVRCVPIDGLNYCLHRGWEDSTNAATQDVKAAESIASSMTANAVAAADSSGDMSLVTALRSWAKLSYSKRVAEETAELDEAVAAAGKEVFYTDVVLNQEPLPTDFATAFPNLASWIPIATAILARESQLTAHYKRVASTTPNINPVDPPVANNYTTMSTSKMQKQQKSNWCGPASLQAFVWNSPSGAVYESQTYWAGILGVTAAGTSTYIVNLKDEINSRTTWDSTAYAGTYAVVSISTWTKSDWENLFQAHLGTQHAPIQLHPVLSAANTDYYPTTTSGHFDVGRGYDLDYAGNGGAYADKVYIYEPAGGPAENNVYTSLTATDSFEDVQAANLANTSQRDIAY